MKQSNKTKKSLLASFMALVMCFSMFAGTTMAWFTDTATAGVQNIVAGNLKVDIVDADGETLTGRPLNFKKAEGHEDEELLWEPGVSYELETFYIQNKGNLALKYQLYTNGAIGDTKLMDAIDFTVEMGGQTIDLADFEGTLNKKGDKSGAITIKAHMDEDAGNQYQGLKLEGVGITVYAAQASYESDSFGKDYDEGAKYSIINSPVNVTYAIPAEKIDTETNTLKEAVVLDAANGVNATIPAGTKLADDASQFKFTIDYMPTSGADIDISDDQTQTSVDVHIEGVAEDNTTPIEICLGNMLSTGLNKGNYDVYHVEDGSTNTMTENGTLSEHNQFEYDPATGFVTIAIATFSEVSAVAEPEEKNIWNGEIAENLAGGTGTEADPYLIANADQFVYFGDLISNDNDNYGGKYYKLIADINLGGEENANDGIIFYPIGYHKVGGEIAALATDDAPEAYYEADTETERQAVAVANAEGDTTWYTYGGSFKGTFNGNGHTISNIYQNTWQMKGNYDGNYWNAAMGLFGYVNGGTVKNLTVNNFSSDGEFTPTGVIAAYAANSTFENIAITNCNPRVYNTGNGGIVGIGGNTSDPDTHKLTFTNITIDNSNKISALWGSWDVACGGLVGMFRGAGHVYMTNCHVAAQIDVYNDVCGNYQYYWYRYAGMMVGTNKNMTTNANGYTVPETSKFHAENCTVHFGEWNNYWYCELVANSLASYTHDHQFSRLTQVDSIDVENMTVTVDGKTIAIPESGRANYVIAEKVGDEYSTENATCYHFVNGAVWNHTDACEETVNGKTVLKEDKQHVYLPFNQLFTGYGWGVKHIPVYNGADYAFDGITILDRTEANSVEKFAKADTAKDSYTTESTVTIGELFKAATIEDEKLTIKADKVQVTVSPVGDASTAGGTYTPAEKDENGDIDWTQGTLTFSGTGDATITITDYYFCTPTTITVTVTERQAEEKFESKFTGDFLYRVGNQNTVALGTLFEDDKDNLFDIKGAEVTITNISDNATGTYTSNTTWTKGTIQFSGTGVVKVAITDEDYCIPTELYLEVVDAKNATAATDATSNNVVLLNDISSGFTVSGRYAVYGNGFTLNYTGNGQYSNNGLKQGVVTVKENGTLDNLRINASIYPAAYLYYSEAKEGPSDGNSRYYYQLSAVAASGNATISNCYIYGGRNNIFVNTGDVTITDTVLENGVVANVQIQSNASHTITFNNVTTIQNQVNPTIGETSNVMLGAGVLVGPETNDNPAIVLNDDFKQYNWVTAEDESAVTNSTAQKIIQTSLEATEFNHTVNGKTASNLGIIYLNEYAFTVTNNTGLPYESSGITMLGQNGQVYSLQGATESQIYSDYANADRSTVNGYYEPQFKYSADLGGQYVAEGGDEHCYREGDTIHVMFPSGDAKELDLAALVNIAKYTGQDLGLSITCKDSSGDAVTVTDGKITLSEIEEYIVTYAVTDTLFYDKEGNTVEDTRTYSWDVAVSVSLKDTAVPDAYFEFDSTKQTMGYAKKSLLAGGQTQYLPFLAGLKIYDYNGQTSYLRFDGDNDFNKIASATIIGYTSANHVLIEVKLTDGGVINIDTTARAVSGGSTYTGTINTSGNTIYYVNDGTTSATTTTWVISSYKFTGNNGVAVDSGSVTFADCENGSVPTDSFSTTINYTVSYDANGGNCGQTTGYATSASAAVTLPTPTRSGYIFAGWYTAASGGTRVGGAGESYTPSADISLYAQWGKPCTVTYDANGGSCGTASAYYDGTALTLPTATRDGYWFSGWYDAAEGGNKIGDAGATYNPASKITLYAHWQEQVKYTVTYNANEGTCDTESATYEGTALTLPTATKTGSNFLGWYTAESGGTKIGDAGESYTPSANITLYAQWEKIPYTIKVTTSNATVSGVTNYQKAYYGDTITFTVSYSGSSSKKTTVTDANGNTVTTTGSYTFTMPASDVTIDASSSTCVTPDTLITLVDGTQKEIQYVTYEDQILVWDFYTGSYTVAPPSIVMNHGYDNYEIVTVEFEDGTFVNTINGHGFYDVDTNEFVILTASNVADYIGHNFVKQNGNGYTTVKLVDYSIKNEYTESWSVLTSAHYNCILENMWTLTPAEIENSPAYLMPFEIGEDMKYVEDSFKADIEKYGLYEYADFAEYMTEAQFKALNLPIFKVAVGKGYIAYEDILYLIGIHIG